MEPVEQTQPVEQIQPDEQTQPVEQTNTETEVPPTSVFPPVNITISPYIMTLDELMSTTEAKQNKENQDRDMLVKFVEPEADALKRRLLQWASVGFPDAYVLSSVSVEVPLQCVDGQTRDKFNYIQYLLGCTLYEKFQALQAKLSGMSLSYSLPSDQVCMHVSRS